MTHTDEDKRVWEQLKRAQRVAGPADPRWEALTRGTLTAEDAEVLRAEDPEKYELFRAFTEDERERILANVRAKLKERAGGRTFGRGMIVLVVVAIVLSSIGARLLWTKAGVGAALLIACPLGVGAFVADSARRARRSLELTRKPQEHARADGRRDGTDTSD